MLNELYTQLSQLGRAQRLYLVEQIKNNKVIYGKDLSKDYLLYILNKIAKEKGETK